MSYKINLFMSEREGVQKLNWQLLACFFAIIGMIGVNVSSTVTSLSFILAALCGFVSVGPRNFYLSIRQFSFPIPLLLLLIMLFIAVFYNNYDSARAWHQFTKYAGKIVFFLLLIPAFTEKKYRNYFYNGTVVAIFLVSMLVYVIYYMVPALQDNSYLFTHYVSLIPWGYSLAFACFLLANQIIEQSEYRIIRGIILFWFLFALYFMNMERSAMLVGIILAATLCVQRLHWRRALLAGVILVLLSCALFFISSKVHNRTMDAYHNIVTYFSTGSPWGPLNERFYMIKQSFTLIKSKPWFGYGTGSFAYAYHNIGSIIVTGAPLAGQPKNVLYLGDPHNSFLHLWVQLGIFGLVFYIAFLVCQFVDSFKLPRLERNLAQGLIISFTFLSCCISAFLRQSAVVFYLIMLAALFGAGIRSLKN